MGGGGVEGKGGGWRVEGRGGGGSGVEWSGVEGGDGVEWSGVEMQMQMQCIVMWAVCCQIECLSKMC